MKSIKLIFLLFSNTYITSGKATKSDSEKSDEKNNNSKIIKKDEKEKFKIETKENILKNIFYENSIINNSEYRENNDYIINKSYKVPNNTNNYFYIQNINNESLKLLKKLIENNLGETPIEKLFKNSINKEKIESDNNHIETSGEIFLSNLILITGLKQYASIIKKNQNYLLKEESSLNINEQKISMRKSMMKEAIQSAMHKEILKICNNLDSFKEIEKFLSKKVKNFKNDFEEGTFISDGTLNLIKFKKVDHQYIFEYIREDYVSINTIIEILLINNIIANEKDFINLMELNNKFDNIFHFKNIIESYFDKENMYPYHIRFVIKHTYDDKLNILEEKKYISGMNIDNIQNNEVNKKFNEFNELKKNNFVLLDIISNNTIEYIKNQISSEEKKELIINKSNF